MVKCVIALVAVLLVTNGNMRNAEQNGNSQVVTGNLNEDSLRAVQQRTIAELRQRPLRMRFTALDGRVIDLNSLRGKVVLLEFSDILHCPPCIIEMKNVRSMYDKYKSRGFEVITVLHNDESERQVVSEKLKLENVKWPHLFIGNSDRPGPNEYAQRFGIYGIPRVFLFDRKGLLIEGGPAFRGTKIEVAVRQVLSL